MKKIIFLLAVLCNFVALAQTNYDVVILSKKFDFLKEENKYNLNALTKSFFESEGFKVFYTEDNLPIEIANNRCNALFINVISNSGVFMTKLVVELSDCQNNEVFSSATGMSREKSYDKAYNESLRSALISMRGHLKIKNVNASVVEKVIVEKKLEEVKDEIEGELVKEKDLETKSIISVNPKQLFATSTPTGYSIINSQKTVVMVLYKTSVKNVFIADKGNEKGVFLKINDDWYFEYNFDDNVFSEKLEVKF